MLAQDYIYRQGAFVRVGGSFGMRSAGNNVAVTLKVIVHDIDNATMQFSPSPPASAYIVSGTTTTKPFFVSKFPSGTPSASSPSSFSIALREDASRGSGRGRRAAPLVAGAGPEYFDLDQYCLPSKCIG